MVENPHRSSHSTVLVPSYTPNCLEQGLQKKKINKRGVALPMTISDIEVIDLVISTTYRNYNWMMAIGGYALVGSE